LACERRARHRNCTIAGFQQLSGPTARANSTTVNKLQDCTRIFEAGRILSVGAGTATALKVGTVDGLWKPAAPMAASLAAVTSTMAAATAGFAPGQVAATLGVGGLGGSGSMDLDHHDEKAAMEMDIDRQEQPRRTETQPPHPQTQATQTDDAQRPRQEGQAQTADAVQKKKKSLNSRHLELADFQKVRTLGTGMHCPFIPLQVAWDVPAATTANNRIVQ
jgi:hypothetical protein